ncbi:cobalamin-binding protein [Dasania sp. GY-MA-18]|uniref:Cobalamin-binding protein n=1 Tax=Dasania phycosphaerae TaxID=2950436 RepID=A0A9J6RL64_9GAMM|nr:MULTISPECIES: cobalamin-binding protein [Dasania]MCR8922499.1 cobalamin-binding protein [Dasania sp. GY-MA-18]MCZ0864927.1 cobalamin-binding protein [Dasania phycosphaerae]MCZ0868655.1 cobalamin-binding protein [Dasania phycosphaerae]
MMKLLVLCIGLFNLVPALAIQVTDDSGQVIQLDKPASRVVALAPHIVELVYAVGAGDKLVGAVSYSDYPEAAKKVPRVGNYKNFSAEAILRLQPDLILAWHSGNGAERIKKIEELGIKVYWGEPQTLESVGESLRKVGLLLGEQDSGAAAKHFNEKLSALRQQYQHKNPVSVFYQVWNEPLQTLNGDSLLSDVISLCGGHNVFADEPALAPKLSVESVLHANPQVIIASGMGVERPEWLDVWLEWPQLQAVVNKQLYFIPPDILQRHTPRILQGAEIMCQKLELAREVYQ